MVITVMICVNSVSVLYSQNLCHREVNKEVRMSKSNPVVDNWTGTMLVMIMIVVNINMSKCVNRRRHIQKKDDNLALVSGCRSTTK